MSERAGKDGLDHSPVMEPRAGFRGEQVFTRLWAEWMDGKVNDFNNETPLECVLADYRFSVGQREATVAASVIGWLGCGCGQSLLIRAHDLAKTWDGSRSDAYQMAWMNHNRRRRAHNSGMRALEIIMEVADQESAVSLTAEDHEVAEMIWCWLGTDIGQDFLKACEEATIDRGPAPGVLPYRANLTH